MRFFPSFLGTKNMGDVCGLIKGLIYPLANWLSTNASTSLCSSTDRGINRPFLGWKSYLRSILWSQGLCTGICSDFVFENTFKYFQYSRGTHFCASSRSDSSTDATGFCLKWLIAWIHVSWVSIFHNSLAKHVSRSDWHSWRHLFNIIFPEDQSTSGLCFRSQVWPRISGVFPR